MLKAGAHVFVMVPDSRDVRVMHPARVEETRRGGVRIEVLRTAGFELDLDRDLAPEREVLLYYDDVRMFMEQRARVVGVEPSPLGLAVALRVDAEPVSAESRVAARVSAIGTNMRASLGIGAESGEVVDISSVGFALIGSASVEAGMETRAVLYYGSDDLDGSVSVRNVCDLGDGRRRFGVLCIGGLLKFALPSINLEVQRNHLRRLCEEAHTPSQSLSPESLPTVRSIERAPAAPGRQPARETQQASAPSRRVVLPFRSLLAFEQEFQRNISVGGIFIPTIETFRVGELIEVELDLRFCDHRVVLAAEVMNCVPPDAPAGGGRVGCAVRFVETGSRLRELLSEIVGVGDLEDPAPGIWSRRPGGPRPHRRTRTRIAAVIEHGGHSRPAHTRNVSRSGALIASDAEVIPIGDPVHVTLVDPRKGESVRIQATVVRHVEHDGRVTCMGTRFDLDPNEESPITRFVDEIQSAARTQQLGCISGSVATLGLPNLLQMLALCVDEGTLTLGVDEEEAVILLEYGNLRHARARGAVGLKALARVLEWEEGDFVFSATIAPDEPAGVSIPIEHALLECTHQLDELHRFCSYPLPLEGVIVPGEKRPDHELSAAEREVIELVGSNVREVLDHFPVYDTEVFRVLDRLLDAELIGIRSA